MNGYHKFKKYMILDKNKLTDKELQYFQIMNGKYGVLYLKGKPGIGKSAILKSIATKLNYKYIDLRLSMIDETDIGLYPYLQDIDNTKVIDFAIPKWAIEANKQPTIIHFEELNRASLQVRNAALQILLERQIGTTFIFNDNVLMCSSGNLGDEDNTDVNEFDNALNNRLIHVNYDLTLKEWIDCFAKENIWGPIIKFLEAKPQYFYHIDKEGEPFATPRSWTMLSKFIENTFGLNKKVDNAIIDVLTKVAYSYIGTVSTIFIKYLYNFNIINIDTILNEFDDSLLLDINRATLSELLSSFEYIDINMCTKDQVNNICKFLEHLEDDEKIAYLKHIQDADTLSNNAKYILKYFKDISSNIIELISKNELKGIDIKIN
jgi:hypothetical protein